MGKQDVSYEITEHEPPRRSAFRGTNGAVRSVGSVTIDPLDDGARSRLTLEFELQGHGYGKLLAPLGNREARKHVPEQQAKIKERLESGA
jgi:hypothetical protein